MIPALPPSWQALLDVPAVEQDIERLRDYFTNVCTTSSFSVGGLIGVAASPFVASLLPATRAALAGAVRTPITDILQWAPSAREYRVPVDLDPIGQRVLDEMQPTSSAPPRVGDLQTGALWTAVLRLTAPPTSSWI